MTEPTNKDRAERAKIILDLYAEEQDRVEDYKFNMALLLGALRHLCDSEGWSFHELDTIARGHYLVDLEWEEK